MGLIVLASLIVGIGVSLYNGNRKLPLTLLGLAVLVFFSGAWVGAWFTLAGYGILTIIIWMANKFDMA